MHKGILESRLQSECFLWHWNTHPEERGRLFMIYNTPRNAVSGSILKGMGMIKGVSDMIYLSPGMVSFLEFKIAGGRQSAEQELFGRMVVGLGFKYFIVNSIEDFKKIIYESGRRWRQAD